MVLWPLVELRVSHAIVAPLGPKQARSIHPSMLALPGHAHLAISRRESRLLCKTAIGYEHAFQAMLGVGSNVSHAGPKGKASKQLLHQLKSKRYEVGLR